MRPVQGDTSPAGKRRDDGRDDRLGWAEPLFNDLDALHGAPSTVTVDEPWRVRRCGGFTGEPASVTAM